MQNILSQVERLQPNRVVIDSLSEIRLLARDSLRYRRQILAFKHFFTNRKCTVVLLDDRTATDRDLQLQSIAHGVLMLERVPRDYGRHRRRVQVAKMRGSVYREGYHDYTITTGGVEVYPRLVASSTVSVLPTELHRVVLRNWTICGAGASIAVPALCCWVLPVRANPRSHLVMP